MNWFFIEQLLSGINRENIFKAIDKANDEIEDMIIKDQDDFSNLIFIIQHNILNSCEHSKELSKYIVAYCTIVKFYDPFEGFGGNKYNDKFKKTLRNLLGNFSEVDRIVKDLIEYYEIDIFDKR